MDDTRKELLRTFKDYPNNRSVITDIMSTLFSQILDEDEFNKIANGMKQLSNEEFLAFCVKCLIKYKYNQSDNAKTNADFYNDMLKMKRNYKHTASDSFYAPIIDEFEVRRLLSMSNKTNPSDIICLNHKEDNDLADLWEKPEDIEDEFITVPSDIFFAGTIPLLDFELELDERELGLAKFTTRFVIFEDYEKIIEKSNNEPCCVGTVFYGNEILMPIYVINGVSVITSKGYAYICEHKYKLRKMNVKDFSNCFIGVMETWYSIQIALLHPSVKDIFKHPVKEKQSMNSLKKYGKKVRKVKYIKKHIVSIDELENAMYEDAEHKHIKRHCLVWYVIGHWRKYKDGKKVFIKPYWKGALKGVKKNIDTRQRIIESEVGQN